MGFLSRIFGGGTDEPQHRRPSLPHVHIEGDNHKAIYVYDGRPLSSVKKGDVVRLEAMPGNVTMTSTLTGTTWSSADSQDIPLAYKGRAVGFTSAECAIIRELLDRGHTVSIAAMRTGTYAKGIPELKALMPKHKDVASLL